MLQWRLTFFEFVQLVDQNLFRVLQHACNQINDALENIERGENGEVSEDDREMIKPFLLRRTWVKNTLVTFQIIFFLFLILQNKKNFFFLKNSCYGVEIKYLPPSNVVRNGTCMPANVYVTFREIYMPKNASEEIRFVNPFVNNIPSGSGLFMSTMTFSR